MVDLRGHLEAAIHYLRCGQDDDAQLALWRAMKCLDDSEIISQTADGPTLYYRLVFDERVTDFQHSTQFEWTKKEAYDVQ